MVRKQRMDKRTAMQAMLDTVQKMRESRYTSDEINMWMYDSMWYYNRHLFSDVLWCCKHVKARP